MPSPFQGYKGMIGGTLPEGYAQMADRSQAAANIANAGTAQAIRTFQYLAPECAPLLLRADHERPCSGMA